MLAKEISGVGDICRHLSYIILKDSLVFRMLVDYVKTTLNRGL